ncbi:MAG: ABC transporter ATP-binding protein [Anaerolineales bacterium]|nr:ABC transporter ATP-binding protein [Anaerolineales bacterium]
MSFSMGPGMGPRQALGQFGRPVKDGRFFDKRVVSGMLTFIRPYSRRLWLALLLTLLVTGFTLLTPYLIRIAIDDYISVGDADGLANLALGIAASYVGLYLSSAGQELILGVTSQRILADVRQRLFRHLQQLSLSYHDRTIIGVTVSRVINDVAIINDLLTQALISLMGDVLVLGGIIIIMITMSPRLAAYTLLVLPLMMAATYIFSTRAKEAFRRTRSSVARVVGSLAENISAIRIIQAFNQEEAIEARFATVNEENRLANVEAMRLSFIFLPSIEFLGMLATCVVIYFGGVAVAGNDVTLGIMVAFLAYVTRFFQPIQELSRLYTTMQSAMAGGEQVLRLLNTVPEIADRPDAETMPEITGRIQLQNVHFRYNNDGPEILNDINLTVEPGQTIALVGPTGAGKTTIANLIPRFYDVVSGQVLIDGRDVRSVTQASLRRQFGLVPQDPFLFAGTIAANIAYGNDGASQADIVAAAEFANAHEFIQRLPDGYETEILEGAVNLSVGQRQLLCIARAALVDPRILILDEATASVDTVTEVYIQSALDRLMAGRTAIVIAHRLTTIRNADLICVVQAGQITQRGTHDELIAETGLYQDLYERQFLKQ